MTDRDQIESLGGPAKVVGLLGYTPGLGSYRRVYNWMRRGIPLQVKLDHPDLFPHEPSKQSIPARKSRRVSVRKSKK